jgi:hypothetical protein
VYGTNPPDAWHVAAIPERASPNKKYQSSVIWAHAQSRIRNMLEIWVGHHHQRAPNLTPIRSSITSADCAPIAWRERRDRVNCWAFNNGVEDPRSGGMPCERQQFLWRQRFDTCRHDRCWKEPGPSPMPCTHNAAHAAVKGIAGARHQSGPVIVGSRGLC